MYWYHVSRTDTRARLLADRHYSRQTIGYREFCAPGNNVVLIIPKGCTAVAVWVSQRPDPKADLDKPRADGFDYWNNGLFRNESNIKSSILIREAIAITRYLWGDDFIPRHGFHSFVDPDKVRGVKVRGETIHGFSFMKAGFKRVPQLTKTRGLIRWVMGRQSLMQIKPVAPSYEQMKLVI